MSVQIGRLPDTDWGRWLRCDGCGVETVPDHVGEFPNPSIGPHLAVGWKHDNQPGGPHHWCPECAVGIIQQLATDVAGFLYARWRRRNPEEAQREPDPRVYCDVCDGCRHGFGWRGYGGLCDWCWEEAERAA